jgi:hypothetical protein
MGEDRTCVGKPEANRPFVKRGSSWKNEIEMRLRETEWGL